jgi:AraC-like DNA-binding protein
MQAAIETRTLFRSAGAVELGEFRCVPGQPGFVRRSVARSHLLAFPRTCTEVTQAGREALVATPALAVVYNAGCEYTARTISPDHERTVFVRLGHALLVEALSEFDPGAGERGDRPLAFARSPVSAATYMGVLELAAHASERDPLAVEEGLLGLVRTTLAAGASGAGAHRKPAVGGAIHAEDYARWTQEHIARTYREPQSIHDIAARIGLSTYHLCRVFRAQTGDTLHGFRDRLRLRAALNALGEPDANLAAVAVDVGYSSQSHFCDAFRRSFGVTPGVARELLRRDPGGGRTILEDRRRGRR